MELRISLQENKLKQQQDEIDFITKQNEKAKAKVNDMQRITEGVSLLSQLIK